jgi:hypothetical protein
MSQRYMRRNARGSFLSTTYEKPRNIGNASRCQRFLVKLKMSPAVKTLKRNASSVIPHFVAGRVSPP